MTQSQTVSKPVLTDELLTNEREPLIARALTASTPAQIGQATQDLRQWLAAHPEDIGMEDLFEVLALRMPALVNVSMLSQEAA